MILDWQACDPFRLDGIFGTPGRAVPAPSMLYIAQVAGCPLRKAGFGPAATVPGGWMHGGVKLVKMVKTLIGVTVVTLVTFLTLVTPSLRRKTAPL